MLIVTPDVAGPIKNGGIGTACHHYARTLANAGVPTTILFTGPLQNGSVEQWVKSYAQRRIEFLCLDDFPGEKIKTYGLYWHGVRSKTVAELLRNRHFDYVLFQDWQANGFWPMRCKLMGLAFANTTLGVITHSPSEWQREGMRTFGPSPLEAAALEWEERETIAAADILVSPSHHMVQWLREHDYKLPAKIEICPITYEDDVQASNLAQLDRDHLIFFGRLETRKGLHLLCGALSRLRDEGGHLPRKLSLLGKMAEVAGVPTQSYLEKFRATLPEIECHVETDLDSSAAIDYIRWSNAVVVMPSLLDNYPVTVIECITNGFSFIASNIGGIPEMVDSNVLFDPNEISLKNKLKDINNIEFAALRHRYEPSVARKTWLDHVHKHIKEPVKSPYITIGRDEGVSVCVPFYHFDHHFSRLIFAFLQMRDPELQLVLVNDGTLESECPEFMRLKPKLELLGHVVHVQENAGAGAARNKAAELAQHDLLLFFDADNLPFPESRFRLAQRYHH